LAVTPGYFELLGTAPLCGRVFADAERDARVIILGHALWQRRFQGDRTVVGRRISVDGISYTVVGVMPPDLFSIQVLDRPVEAFVPLPLEPTNRADHSFFVYGLLRAGTSVAQAQAEMDTISRRLGEAFPESDGGWRTDVRTLADDHVAPSRPTLELLLVATGLLLLLVCANVANLLLARTLPRRREMSIRLALGASRGRLTTMLLLESALLGLCGGVLGLVLSIWSIDFLQHALSDSVLHRVAALRLTLPVAAASLALSLASGLLFGIAPALRLPKLHHRVIPGAGDGGARHTSFLLAIEVALAVALLSGGALTVRAALALERMYRGFDPVGITSAQLSLPAGKYARAEQQRGFFDRVLERVRALPEVESAALVNFPPLATQYGTVRLIREDRPPNEQPQAEYSVVDAGFFDTMRIAVRAGRPFLPTDDDETRGVAIVSESFVRRYLPDSDPLGRELRPVFPALRRFWIPDSRNLPLRIVGVVADVRRDGLPQRGLPQIYLPYRQNPTAMAHLLVRSRAGPAALAGALAKAVTSVDPDQPLSEVCSFDEAMDRALGRQRLVGGVLAVFALFALVVAAVGVYSVTAHGIERRVPELGIRIALGAARGDITVLVLGRAGRAILFGELAGLAGAWALSRMLAATLAGIPREDALTLAAVAIGVGALALVASYLPARRALTIDPVAALRSE
jgi:predicted permease